MRIARLLSMLLAILTTGLLVAPSAAAEPPLRLATQLTDNAGALSATQQANVQRALDRLYETKRIQLWVVFVDDFSNQNQLGWARSTIQLSDLGDDDALLAVAARRVRTRSRSPTRSRAATPVPTTSGATASNRPCTATTGRVRRSPRPTG